MFAPISRRQGSTPRQPGHRLLMWVCLLIGIVVWVIAHDVLTGTGERLASQSTPSDELPDTTESLVPDAVTLPPAESTSQPILSMPAMPADSGAWCSLSNRRQADTPSASANERRSAANWWLQSQLAINSEAMAAAVSDDASCRQAQQSGFHETARFCSEVLGRTEAALLQSGSPAVDGLARLAATTRDAAVYALAYQACHPPGLSFQVAPTACRLLSVEQWAHVDPDNAVPWLHLALQASAALDRAGVDDAIRRAGAASRVETHTQGVRTGEVDPDTSSPSAAYLDAAELHCGATALSDSGRALVCESLARVLVSRSHSAADILAGVQLGERLGWPAEETSLISRTLRAQPQATEPARALIDPCASRSGPTR